MARRSLKRVINPPAVALLEDGYAGLRWRRWQPRQPGDASLFFDDAAAGYPRGMQFISVFLFFCLSQSARHTSIRRCLSLREENLKFENFGAPCIYRVCRYMRKIGWIMGFSGETETIVYLRNFHPRRSIGDIIQRSRTVATICWFFDFYFNVLFFIFE